MSALANEFETDTTLQMPLTTVVSPQNMRACLQKKKFSRSPGSKNL